MCFLPKYFFWFLLQSWKFLLHWEIRKKIFFNYCYEFHFFIQLEVLVYDERYPLRVNTATVNAIVTRNENSPEFNPAGYDFTIDETAQEFKRVGQVFAFDKDDQVSYD